MSVGGNAAGVHPVAQLQLVVLHLPVHVERLAAYKGLTAPGAGHLCSAMRIERPQGVAQVVVQLGQ